MCVGGGGLEMHILDILVGAFGRGSGYSGVRRGGGGALTGTNSAGSGRYGGAAAMSGGSFNSNFNQHKREWSISMRKNDGTGSKVQAGKTDETSNQRAGDYTGGSSRAGKGTGSYGGKGEPPRGNQLSTDDRVFEQFKKRVRR